MKKVLGWLVLSMVLTCSAMTAEEPKEEPIEQPKTDTTQKAVKDTTMKETSLKDVSVPKPAVEIPWTTNKSGLKWREKIVGKGTEAKMNMPVNCHYTVWLSDKDGKKAKLIQSSKDTQSLRCTIGQGLIVGWSEGMVGMKEGGTRELIVPPAIGYGASGRGEMIPGNSTLYFEIEFLNEVKK